jgi:predicted nucleic acid-binding protein
MSKVFIDSTAYFAFINDHDDNHATARRIFHRLARDPSAELYTTSFIVAETHVLILNRLRRQDIGSQFLRDVGRSVTHRIHITEQTEREAERFIEQHPAHTYSLADATSFVVMRQLHITTAFSFDADFRDAGFALLEP